MLNDAVMGEALSLPEPDFRSVLEAISRACYRVLLEREPEANIFGGMTAPKLLPEQEQAIRATIEGFQRSEELENIARHKYRNSVRSPFGRIKDDALCLLHLEKTAGTSLVSELRRFFHPHEIFDQAANYNRLSCMMPDETCDYRFFHGHFDYFDSCFIHAKRIVRIAVFREPVERLISFYNFHRAHPANRRLENPFVALAQQLGPEEFFSSEQVTANCRVNNYYLHVFGNTLFRHPMTEESEISSSLALAKERISRMEIVGLSHRMVETLAIIRHVAKIPVADRLPMLNITTDLAEENNVRIDEVEVCGQLHGVLDKLTKYDQELYDLARCRFERLLLETADDGCERESYAS